ncbi:RNA-directed DNA polymerase, eukaryota, reverse transcriptase zinc-binding domain protein [Tanacetum coccineum]
MSRNRRSSFKRKVKILAKFDNHVINQVKQKKADSVNNGESDEIRVVMYDSKGESFDDGDGTKKGVFRNMNCYNNMDQTPPIKDKGTQNQNKTYASIVQKEDMLVDKKLHYIAPSLNSDRAEVVVFDDEIMMKGCEKWKLTACSYFIRHEMGFYELRYHLRRMWAKYGLRDVIVNANGTIMFKFRDEIGMKKVIDQSPWMVKNVPLFMQQWNPKIGMKVTEPEKLPIRVKLMNLPMEAWSVEGISTLASGIGTPIVMDNTTAHMCQYGSRRSDFARVLIEIDAKKEMKDVIKIEYTNKERKVRGTKEVKIGYNWKPLMCSHCKVFGHNHDKCTVRPRIVEEIAAKKRDEENM